MCVHLTAPTIYKKYSQAPSGIGDFSWLLLSFGLLTPKDLNYFTFQSVDYDCT